MQSLIGLLKWIEQNIDDVGIFVGLFILGFIIGNAIFGLIPGMIFAFAVISYVLVGTWHDNRTNPDLVGVSHWV